MLIGPPPTSSPCSPPSTICGTCRPGTIRPAGRRIRRRRGRGRRAPSAAARGQHRAGLLPPAVTDAVFACPADRMAIAWAAARRCTPTSSTTAPRRPTAAVPGRRRARARAALPVRIAGAAAGSAAARPDDRPDLSVTAWGGTGHGRGRPRMSSDADGAGRLDRWPVAPDLAPWLEPDSAVAAGSGVEFFGAPAGRRPPGRYSRGRRTGLNLGAAVRHRGTCGLGWWW